MKGLPQNTLQSGIGDGPVMSGERGYLPPTMPLIPPTSRRPPTSWVGSSGGVGNVGGGGGPMFVRGPGAIGGWKLPPQQSESIDLSTQPLRNGDSPLNGQVKEVSVIAANPATKPLDTGTGRGSVADVPTSQAAMNPQSALVDLAMMNKQTLPPHPLDIVRPPPSGAAPHHFPSPPAAASLIVEPARPHEGMRHHHQAVPLQSAGGLLHSVGSSMKLKPPPSSTPMPANVPPRQAEMLPQQLARQPVESPVRQLIIDTPPSHSVSPTILQASVPPAVPSHPTAVAAPPVPTQLGSNIVFQQKNPTLSEPQEEPKAWLAASLPSSSLIPPQIISAHSNLEDKRSTPPVASLTPSALPGVQMKQESENPGVLPATGSPMTPVDSSDAVESLLEDMFEDPAPPSTPSVIVSPPLTQDKVVAILEDKSPPQTPQKEEDIKPEIKQETPTENKNPFTQVESELEKMFAGIVEDEEEKKPPLMDDALMAAAVPASSTPPTIVSTPAVGNRKRRGGGTGSGGRAATARAGNYSKPPEKKKKSKKEFGPGPPGLVTPASGSTPVSALNASGAFASVRERMNKSAKVAKGFVGGAMASSLASPYIHVEGPKNKPLIVTVVNSGLALSSGGEEDSALAKITPRLPEPRNRALHRGLYSSTLSSKYNSNNVDPSWICAFCGRRPHCENGLGGEPAGDLFGPYMIELGEVEIPPDKEVSAEQRRRGWGRPKSIRSSPGKIPHNLVPHHHHHHHQNKEIEVWVHEECAVWSGGILVVGGRLLGLSEAVSQSKTTKCKECGTMGASLSCMARACPNVSHYPCCRQSLWQLHIDNFTVSCPDHQQKSGNKGSA